MTQLCLKSLIKPTLLLATICGLSYAQDTSRNVDKFPIDQIKPHLRMFERHVDYRQALSHEVLAPQRISIGEKNIRVGMFEPTLIKVLGEPDSILEREQYRNRDQQWAYIRRIASENDNSMHFYILQDVYYDQQLFGWFKLFQWSFEDFEIRAHIVRSPDESRPHVWLLHFLPDSTSLKDVTYNKTSSLSLTRVGRHKIVWNVDNNSIVVIQ